MLRGADVGVVPYAVNELTRSIFPMKIYEYLAAGLPVVTTPLPALDEIPDVHRAGDVAGFVDAVASVLAEDTPDRRRARSQRARAHSWDARLDELGAAVERTAALPVGGRR